MGRINLTPLRVRKRALANIETKRTSIQPKWLDITGDIPPAQILIRPLPNPQPVLKIRTRTLPSTNPSSSPRTETYILPDQRSKPRHKATRKPSRLFCPINIRYEEDQLRKQFFSDHPWELARPRVVLETSGDSHAAADWSTGLRQPGFALSGESVVQRQLHLLNTVPDITVSQSYDIARKEFYDLRRQQETERRVAAEEARHTGVSFGRDIVGFSLDIEDKHAQDWERWSREQVMELMQKNAAFEGTTMPSEEDILGEATNEQGSQSTGSSTFAQEASMAAGKNKGSGRGRVVQE